MTIKTHVQSIRFTCADMDRYLATLTHGVKELHDKAYLLFRDNEDTLSEDFQMAALVVGVFQNRAIEIKQRQYECLAIPKPRKRRKKSSKGK